ncbi:cupin domain-containing protein [Variovorax sp. tm]|uniref:cupin domain-containing protein n=1 Tax=Variovorax atrisoli TaxID=3394203 RepID=UPI003A804490
MNRNGLPLAFEDPHGDSVVIPQDSSESWWQPQPANGHAEVILSPRNIRSVHKFSVGTQTLPPGGTVRLHSHDRSEEVLYVLEGEGAAEVDGKKARMAPNTTLYLGHNQTHTFTNDGTVDLKWVWFFMPGGLEDFFEGIGRKRATGEPAPVPFARPADVKEIEAKTVFAKS